MRGAGGRGVCGPEEVGGGFGHDDPHDGFTVTGGRDASRFRIGVTTTTNQRGISDAARELADLVENYIPASVRSRADALGESFPFARDEPKYKIVLSLREDFVWRLDSLRKAMPSVMHNRYAIARMNGDQALEHSGDFI